MTLKAETVIDIKIESIVLLIESFVDVSSLFVWFLAWRLYNRYATMNETIRISMVII